MLALPVPKRTGHRGSQSDKGNSIDGVLKVDEATEMAGNVTNDGGTDTDHGNRDDEARVTVGNSCVNKNHRLKCISFGDNNGPSCGVCVYLCIV